MAERDEDNLIAFPIAIPPDQAEGVAPADASAEVEATAAARLHDYFERWARSLDDEERAALAAYQATDRTYALVNGLLRGIVGLDDLEEHDRTNFARIIAGVRTAIAAGSCQDDVVVWRGVRNVTATFGVDPANAGSLAGKVRIVAGFLSTTVFRSIAMGEFVGSKQGALLRIRASAGVKAAWLPPVGDPTLSYQGELLLEEDLQLHIQTVSDKSGILIIDCEVTP